MKDSSGYLIFQSGSNKFGIKLEEVEKVEKAVLLESITPMPEFVKGILNYHGELLPVINLMKIFEPREREDELSDLILIVNTAKRRQAIWIERVIDVVSREEEDIKDAQKFFIGLDYVKGVFKYSDQTVILSDIDKLLSDSELRKLKKVMDLVD